MSITYNQLWQTITMIAFFRMSTLIQVCSSTYDKNTKSDKIYDQFQVTCIITGPGANN